MFKKLPTCILFIIPWHLLPRLDPSNQAPMGKVLCPKSSPGGNLDDYRRCSESRLLCGRRSNSGRIYPGCGNDLVLLSGWFQICFLKKTMVWSIIEMPTSNKFVDYLQGYGEMVQLVNTMPTTGQRWIGSSGKRWWQFRTTEMVPVVMTSVAILCSQQEADFLRIKQYILKMCACSEQQSLLYLKSSFNSKKYSV
jgi:hypothetical protein